MTSFNFEDDSSSSDDIDDDKFTNIKNTTILEISKDQDIYQIRAGQIGDNVLILYSLSDGVASSFPGELPQNSTTLYAIVNKNGMIAINGSPNKTIMAHPIQFNDQPDKGYVGIKNYKTNKYFPLLVHEETLSNMAMDYYGLLLATSNDKGTIINT